MSTISCIITYEQTICFHFLTMLQNYGIPYPRPHEMQALSAFENGNWKVINQLSLFLSKLSYLLHILLFLCVSTFHFYLLLLLFFLVYLFLPFSFVINCMAWFYHALFAPVLIYNIVCFYFLLFLHFIVKHFELLMNPNESTFNQI